jgi:hypothetical protein
MTTDAEYGYGLASLLFLAIAMQVILNTNGMKLAMSLGYNIRSIFMISVYLKSLNLSARSGGRDSQEERFAGEKESSDAKESCPSDEGTLAANGKEKSSRREKKAAAAAEKAAAKAQRETDDDISSAGRMLQLMSSDAEGFLRIMFSITQGLLSPFMLVFIIYFLAQV